MFKEEISFTLAPVTARPLRRHRQKPFWRGKCTGSLLAARRGIDVGRAHGLCSVGVREYESSVVSMSPYHPQCLVPSEIFLSNFVF